MNLPTTPSATKAAAQSRTPATQASSPQIVKFPPECIECGESYCLGSGVARAVSVATYDRKPDDPVYRPLQVYTLDPASSKFEGATAVLQVPYEPLEPGPKGAVFAVGMADANTRVTVDWKIRASS
jgi:hypothetical protein